MLRDGYTDVPAGRIAAVTTYLQMLCPPVREPVAPPEGTQLRHFLRPDLHWYRTLFQAVGRNWLWFSRLRMSDAELAALLHDEQVDIFALMQGEEAKGLLELDRRAFPDIELAFLGVTEDLIGKGAGRYLIDQAIRRAWSHQPRRLHVHTCTLDHPGALRFYMQSGFVPYHRAVEITPDPRLTGDLPRDTAPHIPIID